MVKGLDFKYTEDKIDEIVNNETGETNPNFIYSDDEEEEVGFDLPSIEKQQINEDDIFDAPEIVKLEIKSDLNVPMEIVEPKIIEEEELLTKAGKPLSVNKSGKPRKTRKPMTEEQKKVCVENLRRGREMRKSMTDENVDKRKVNQDRERRKRELIEKKKQLELEKLENVVQGLENVVEDTKPKPRKKKVVEEDLKEEEVIKPIKSNSNLTSNDIKQLQLDAILEYDALRKERKKKKNQEKMIQQEKQKLRDSLSNEMKAVPNWRSTAGRFQGYY